MRWPQVAPWIVAASVALMLRVLWGGWSECQTAAHELAAARPYQAVIHYERAVRWYLPGSPYVDRAADALQDVAESAETAGDRELALFAWRGLRSAAYATRSFYQPLSRHIAHSEARIAELMAADPAATWPDRSLDPGERTRRIAENLQQHTDPATAWVVVLELGFVAWLVSGGALAWRLGRAGRRRRTTWILIGTTATGYGLWILGMALA
jgi:hypothetical protein